MTRRVAVKVMRNYYRRRRRPITVWRAAWRLRRTEPPEPRPEPFFDWRGLPRTLASEYGRPPR